MDQVEFTKNSFLQAAKDDPAWARDGVFEPGAAEYLSTYYEDWQQNDGVVLSGRELLALSRNFWMFGQQKSVGKALVRIRSLDVDLSGDEAAPSTHALSGRYDVVEIITDDRRFLVDSIIGEISDHGLDIVALFHPVITGGRDAKGRWIFPETETKAGTETDQANELAVSESMIQIIIRRQTKTQAERLITGLRATLAELEQVVDDFGPMLEVLEMRMADMMLRHGDVPAEEVTEASAFLSWIREGNFVLLGTRSYDFVDAKSNDCAGVKADNISPKYIANTCLGVLRNLDKAVLRQSSEPSHIASNAQAFLADKNIVTVAKSNLFSRVHRRVRMDYISLKHYSENGDVIGETRFVGLFTADAYARAPKYVPLLRRKIEQVQARYGAEAGSHNAKRLDFVLSTYPRDELFQSSGEELYTIATGVAQAYDRPRTRLFVRQDIYGRFVSVLVYVPREHYNSKVRELIGDALVAAYDGRVSAFYPQYSDSPLARVHFIIGLDPDTAITADPKQLERDIAALTEPWADAVFSYLEEGKSQNLGERGDPKNVHPFLQSFVQGVSTDYQNRFDAQHAIQDMAVLNSLSSDEPVGVRVYQKVGDEPLVLRAKFYRLGRRLELSDIMPVFSNMGLHVAQETGYEIAPKGQKQTYWVHDYEMHFAQAPAHPQSVGAVFEAAFLSIWNGGNEDDGFNALILSQTVPWRQIAFLRVLARFRKQMGIDPSEQIQIEALQHYPKITALLLEVLAVKFSPNTDADLAARQLALSPILTQLDQAIDQITSLDHDRALRRMAGVLIAALRTNFYQRDAQGEPLAYISLKINSQTLENIPAPVPYREIFVWSASVEGVHLRFGPVARGGLRWSDRRDDFRTEVLGLVKAQQVKNAVIVPVGSKGCFYPKNLPFTAGRDAVMSAGQAAYRVFISGMLDITDNYDNSAPNGIAVPENTVCWDDPDPYLVVAADKGTATFSDLANGIAKEYGFWLDDGFASGGSVGYDHKAMGITAKGGWEAVKRHFREIGKDIQSEDFTTIGVGDMSGDVFGNGMLLSKHIALIAAFDHRDIFIDPTPNVASSFTERSRLFDVPRSSWRDYDAGLISSGGGVFSRSDKSIALTPEIQAMTGLSEDHVTPNTLIKALLNAECELLWFGGIGTYIKAQFQNDTEVRDKANDAIRTNAKTVRAKVIGEGANLGMTQAGRIEYAHHGGRINTDAIDNSAGVDCSDNEVNIKILLSAAIEAGELSAADRDGLLAQMTDDVSALVLAHNYDQTGALSLAEMRCRVDHLAYGRFMDGLELEGRLDRAVEGLPDVVALQERQQAGQGLYRPELAVLNAYAKIKLYDELMQTDVSDDPYFETVLRDYFPKATHGFTKALGAHRLRREIMMSRLCNQIVDVGGPVFMERLREQTHGSVAEIAKAFVIAVEVLGVEHIRTAIRALDNNVSASAQISLHEEMMIVLQRVIGWLVRAREDGDITARISRRTQGLEHVDPSWIKVLSPYDSRRVLARIGRFMRAGIPQELAQNVSLLRAQASGFEVIALSEQTGWSVRRSAELFYQIGGRFKIDRLRSLSLKNEVTKAASADDHWTSLARRRIDEDFYAAQAALALAAARHFIATIGDKEEGAPVASAKVVSGALIAQNPQAVETYQVLLRDLSTSGAWGLAKFAIMNGQLRELIDALSGR